MAKVLSPNNKLFLSTTVVLTCAMAGPATSAQLEEVLVTAQKRTESLQDVPVSISALSADTVERLKIDNAAQITGQMPNLHVSAPFGDQQPVYSLRGISMVDYNVNQASPIGAYIDEASAGPSFMQGFQVFDLERIEVLRGPQGTLYGKNTTGGAINFITKKPEFENEFKVTAGTGDYNRRHLSGAAEVELVEDMVGVRTAFTYTKTDGYHENHFPGGEDLTETDNYALRVSLRYSSDNFDGLLKVFYGDSSPLASGVVGMGRDPGGFNRLGYLRPENYDAWEGEHQKWGKNDVQVKGTALTLNWDINESYTITSITALSEGEQLNEINSDGAPNRVLEIDWGSEIEQFSQDLRLTTNFDGPFNLIAGVYYSTDEIDVTNIYDMLLGTEDFGIPFDPTLTNSGFSVYQHYYQERDTFALYGHATYDLTEQLTLTLGLRYTDDEGEISEVQTWAGDYNQNWLYNIVPLSFSLDPDLSLPKLGYDDSDPSGKIGLDYKLNDGGLIYASYSRGYRSSSFNGGLALDASALTVADPETVDAYEVGYKNQFFDDRMRLSAALFSNDYKNQQYINIIGAQAFLENADEASILGLEVEVFAKPTDKLTLQLGFGWLDSEYDKASLFDPATGEDVDLAGNTLLQAPELNLSFAVDYQLMSSGVGDWILHLDTVYVDEQWYTAYNDLVGFDTNSADSYTQTNASLLLEDLEGKYSVSLWVKNIEENDEPVASLSVRDSFGYDYNIAPLPLRYGLDFTYHF